MKKYSIIVLLTSTIIATACSNADAQPYEVQEVQEVQEKPETSETPIIIDVESIIEYRDSFKDKEFPTIEEIGEENLASYLLQQFNQEICYEIGNCFCHM